MGQRSSLPSTCYQERYLSPPCSYDDTLPHLSFIQEKGEYIIIPVLKIIPPASKWVIIYSHAQTEDLGVIHDHLVDICEGVSMIVIGYDYPTYGMNTRVDTCSDEAVRHTLLCVYRFARGYSKKILLYGKGVGCWATRWLSQKQRLIALYTDPPFEAELVTTNSLSDIFHSIKSVTYD